VGQLGSTALAGLALVFPLIMLMQQMANGSMAGRSPRPSPARSALDAGGCHALVVHGLVIATAMAAVFTALALVAGPAFYRLMGGRGATLAVAVEYSNAIFAGRCVLGPEHADQCRSGSRTGRRARGVYLTAELVHILLVPTLVFASDRCPHSDQGAGIATVASFMLSPLRSPGTFCPDEPSSPSRFEMSD